MVSRSRPKPEVVITSDRTKIRVDLISKENARSSVRCLKFNYETFNFISGYIDVDCGLRTSDIPSVTGILESPACCSMHCEGDDCVPGQDRCSQVTLHVTNATYNATCRFQVSTVRDKTLLYLTYLQLSLINT